MPRRRSRSGRGSGAAQPAPGEHHARAPGASRSCANGGAEAAPHAAAERDPGVGLGLGLEEALGPEGERLGVEVRAAVHERDRGAERGARGHLVAADLDRRLAACASRRSARAAARWASLTTASRYWPPSRASRGALERLRVAHEPLERPRQLRRGRLVAGQQQRDQVVAQLASSVGSPSSPRASQQHREHVVAALAATRAGARSRRTAARRPRRGRPRSAAAGCPGPSRAAAAACSMIRVPVRHQPHRARARARPSARPPRRRRPCAG